MAYYVKKKRRWHDYLMDGFMTLIVIAWVYFIIKLIYEVIR